MIKIHFLKDLFSRPADMIYYDYKIMTPGQAGIWDDIQATLNPKEADFFVVFGRIPGPHECPKERTIIIGRESRYWGGHVGLRGLDAYYGVYWHDMGNCYLPVYWTIPYDYDRLMGMSEPIPKTKDISTIVSDKSFMPGHVYRLAFLQEFCKQYTGIEVYGKGGRLMPISTKVFGHTITKDWGIIDYKFGIGIENCQSPGYFCGKLIDLFLLWSIPIYWGAPDIGDYFSILKSYYKPGAVIVIPDGDIPKAVDHVIQQIRLIQQDENLERAILNEIGKARQLVLNKYQFWPTLHQMIHERKVTW